VNRQRPTVDFDEKRVDALLAELNQCRLPGAAVGIAIEGKPVYRKGLGLANMELPVALSPSMRLRIGSTSKQFTCFAYLLLCEAGKAGIDDTVGKYFPELHPVAHGVTLRQLMNNTGGLRDVYDIFQQFEDNYTGSSSVAQSVTSADLLSLYRDISDVNAAPGTTWSYNNGGWLILGSTIERITGQPLEQVLRELVFEPVGMFDTLLRRSDRDLLPNSGAQHARNPVGHFEKLYWGLDNIFGAGAVVSTVDDMLRWAAHMDAPVVGNPATWAAMTTPPQLVNGASTGYGLGLVIDRYRGVQTISHAGNALGGSAQMLKVPATGLDVVVIVNREDVSSTLLARQIVDACLPQLEPPNEPSGGPIATGIFRSPTTGRIIQLFEKNGRQMVSVGGNDLPIERGKDGVLHFAFIWSDPKQSVVPMGDPARPSAVLFREFGNVDELLTVPPASQADARRIAGRYRLESVGIEAVISQTDSGTQLRTSGRFGSATYLLECFAQDIWRTRPARLAFLGGLLAFDPDATMFEYSNWLTRPLRFRRHD
jgi:D-aminopeptidase